MLLNDNFVHFADFVLDVLVDKATAATFDDVDCVCLADFDLYVVVDNEVDATFDDVESVSTN
jgi:hypothetical protein